MVTFQNLSGSNVLVGSMVLPPGQITVNIPEGDYVVVFPTQQQDLLAVTDWATYILTGTSANETGVLSPWDPLWLGFGLGFLFYGFKWSMRIIRRFMGETTFDA